MKLKMFENFDDANESNIYADHSIKIEKIEHDAFGSPYVHIIHKNDELIGFVYSKPDQDYWNAVPANDQTLSAEEFLDGISADVEGTTADTFEEAVHELLT